MPKQTDYLIIGSGVAGLATAYFLSELGSVTVMTKGEVRNTNTYWAQGGIAAVLAKEDTFESHIEDTLKTGVGHCNEAAVRQMVFGAPKAIKFLQSIGLKIEKEPMLEAGHSRARVWRSSDFTGRDVLEVLIKAVQKKENISFLEKTDAVELIVDEGECKGAFIRKDDEDEIEKVAAKHTVLATGGLGQLFSKTTNTLGSGGDGLAMAVNAGLELKDIEFIQFHPTALAIPKEGRHFLLSEVLRGMGARVVNKREEAFLNKFDPRAELAPRDLVSRAVYVEELTGPVYLDMRHVDEGKVRKKFPNIQKALKEFNLDLTKDLIPITPVAHYACGGVPTDLKGATRLPGLFAVGEVACTGVHGANRLASNSLLEAVVFAKAIAEGLEKSVSTDAEKNVNIDSFEAPNVIIEDINQVKAYGRRIGQIMWENVGIVRTAEGLTKAKKEIVAIPARDYRIQHRQLVCYKIIEACQARPESLGAHYMTKDIVQ
ncbi:L-aspartate oxidase [Patescibacteria group bacterium]|nr:L-aspartate oxidase [Patescibacteria group bacterium]MBU1016064.1 L-aspartate oxidase [Patescibacteria group bacterium]MBU1685470.1 L-aspartate oxidase [Patescibacteria group bacterium]MBU1938682.1 L-aspartate oxidase [Patescibacteria group bacterium]